MPASTSARRRHPSAVHTNVKSRLGSPLRLARSCRQLRPPKNRANETVEWLRSIRLVPSLARSATPLHCAIIPSATRQLFHRTGAHQTLLRRLTVSTADGSERSAVINVCPSTDTQPKVAATSRVDTNETVAVTFADRKAKWYRTTTAFRSTLRKK